MGHPHIAIIASSVVALILSFSSFAVLVTTVMTLYLVAVALFLIACPVLRLRRPDEPRPFKVPGGFGFLCLMLIIPLGTIAWTLFTQPVEDLMYGLIGLASGPVAYLVFKGIYKGRPGLASEEMAAAANKEGA